MDRMLVLQPCRTSLFSQLTSAVSHTPCKDLHKMHSHHQMDKMHSGNQKIAKRAIAHLDHQERKSNIFIG